MAPAGLVKDQSQRKTIMKNWRATAMLVLFVTICLGIGGFGAIFTTSSVRDWYPTLQKPPWTAPSWLFAPVWTTLYLMMALAAWIVWRKRQQAKANKALALFALQLVLNAAWSPLFFGLHSPLAGLLDIIPLWAAILATVISFWRISPAAGALLIPYLAWVSFATALNFSIWRMN
jgi:translocator protein